MTLMIKKVLLLTCSVAAALALAAPATASAYTWTYNGVEVEGGYSQAFEGEVKFTWPQSYGSYRCNATFEISTEGASVARIVNFTRDFESCFGTGNFSGCHPVEEDNNLMDGILNVASAPAKVAHESAGKYLNFQFGFASGCWAPAMILDFAQLSMTPTLDENGRITELEFTGLNTTGTVVATWDSIYPVGTPELGLN